MAANGSPLAALVPLGIFGGFVFLIFYLRRRQVLRVCAALTAAGADDAKPVSTFGQVVTCSFKGRAVEIELQQGGKNSPAHMFVRTPMPNAPFFEMHLSRQTGTDQRLVQRGLEVDVEVGDPVFDVSVVVEAAPADFARQVLDAPLRNRVMQQLPSTLSVSNGTVRLRRTDITTSSDELRDLVELVVMAANRVDAAIVELEEQRARAGASQEIYRGTTAGGAALREAADGRELARLRQIRRRRVWGFQGLFYLFIVAWIGGSIWWSSAHPRSSPSPTHATTSTTSRSKDSASSQPTAAATKPVPPRPAGVHAAVMPYDPEIKTPVTPDSFCEAIAGALGGSRRAWCTAAEQKRAYTAYVIEESDKSVAACKRSLASSIAAKRVTFDAKAALECIQASNEAFNAAGGGPLPHGWEARDRACKGVLTGQVAEGQSCTGDLECKAGLSCGGKPSKLACKPPAPAAGACGVEIDIDAIVAGTPSTAPPPAYQPYLGRNHQHDACASGLSCNYFLSKCEAVKQKGEECTLVTPCSDGLDCRRGKCTDTPGKAKGQPCDGTEFDSDCVDGISCDPKTHTCAAEMYLIGLCQ